MAKSEKVDGLKLEHIGRLVEVTCKPMAGYHRISAVGRLKGFTYMDGLTVYLEGVEKGVGFPMLCSEMSIRVETDTVVEPAEEPVVEREPLRIGDRVVMNRDRAGMEKGEEAIVVELNVAGTNLVKMQMTDYHSRYNMDPECLDKIG